MSEKMIVYRGIDFDVFFDLEESEPETGFYGSIELTEIKHCGESFMDLFEDSQFEEIETLLKESI
jgi:hypothetical protein